MGWLLAALWFLLRVGLVAWAGSRSSSAVARAGRDDRVSASSASNTPEPAPSGMAMAIASAAASSATPEAPSVPAPAAPSASPSFSAPRTAPVRRAASPRPTHGTKPADDCDPPYTINAENHKIYKRNCIQ